MLSARCLLAGDGLELVLVDEARAEEGRHRVLDEAAHRRAQPPHPVQPAGDIVLYLQ